MSRFKSEGQPEWERHVEAALSLFGHRNWIVVADAAYPAQARPGIRTLLADMDHFEVVEKVLGMILASRHVRPRIYLDRELAFVAEQDAPGVEVFRHQLGSLLKVRNISRVLHEQIIHKLDQSAQLFEILILKTNMTIPYTSVFFELDCGYWHPGAEERLREAMAVCEPSE
jgi:hypothetical protein